MFISKIKLFLILIIIATANFVSADEVDHKESAFKYIAGGSEFTFGFRTHQQHGFDLSFNHNLILQKDYSLKGYYLNYPFYHKKILAYWGIGLGAAYWEKAPFRNGKSNQQSPHGLPAIAQRTYITNGILLGYEFQAGENTKIFAQFELGNGLLFLLPDLFPAFKIGSSF